MCRCTECSCRPRAYQLSRFHPQEDSCSPSPAVHLAGVCEDRILGRVQTLEFVLLTSIGACPNTWFVIRPPSLVLFAYGFGFVFRAGASKQFANLCGIFFASVSWACLVGDKSIGARIMLVSPPRLLVAVTATAAVVARI